MKTGWRRAARGAVLGGLVSAALLPAVAIGDRVEPRLQIAQLGTMKVTALRAAEPLEEIARPAVVVERDAIESLQPPSTAAALRFESNVSVSGGPRAFNQSVTIRGLGDVRVLQVIDGVRQNFASGHRPTYFLDPELLQQIEVVKGPVSSLWGSGALGGVVAQRTLTARELAGADDFGGFLKTGYNDNNSQLSTTVAVAGAGERLDALFSSYYRDGDEIENGRGERLPASAERDRGALAKVGVMPADGQRLELNVRRAESSGHVPSNAAARITTTSNFVIDRTSETSDIALDYRFDPTSTLLDGQAKIYWNNVQLDESRLSDNRFDSTEVEVFGINLNNVSRFGAVSLLYGIDGYREHFDALRSGNNRPAPPAAESNVWGGYVRAVMSLADQWVAEAGLRYDRFATEAENLGRDRSDSDLSPSLALTWSGLSWLELTLRHDRAFRAPSAEELYSTGTHFCIFPGFCNTFIPNPDLAPEEAANTELLARIRLDEVAGGALELSGSIFRNRADQFIQQIVTGPFFFPVMNAGNTTWINVDEAEIEGYELDARYQRGALQAKLAWGHVRGEDRASGDDLANMPADTLSLDVGYGFWGGQLLAGVRLLHAADQTRTDYAGGVGTEYDGYTITDLYASWQPKRLEGIKLDLTLNNVTDRYYRRAWQELYEPGREIIASVRYKF